jgi:hypothetical protein
MCRPLSRLLIPLLAASLCAPAMFASLPSQTPTINVLSTDNHDCVGFSFTARRREGHLYNLKLPTLDRCPNCRIEQASARIVFDAEYSQYKVRFVHGKGSERPTIRIRESERTVFLKGHSEASLRRLFAALCNQGGVQLPIDRPIKLEEEVDGMSIEFARGLPAEVKASVPLSVWVTARDSCGHRGGGIIPLNLMEPLQ